MKASRSLTLSAAFLGLGAFVLTPGVPGGQAVGLKAFSGEAAAQAYGGPGVDVNLFYNELAPYGGWVENPQYGYVWIPNQVPEGWRPYTVGQWMDTNQGWYWDSPEPFAWAVYHYGRWGYDPYYGWYWVPGNVWAPSWVQWRFGDRYVGWAPVAPYGQGYAYGVPTEWAPPVAESWVFVEPRYFGRPNVSTFALSIGNLSVAFSSAPRYYHPDYRNGMLYNYGVPRSFIGRVGGYNVPMFDLHRSDKFYDGHNRYQKTVNKNIYIYAPQVRKDDHFHGKPKDIWRPGEFKPKAKFQHDFHGQPPKGWGPKASEIKSFHGNRDWDKDHKGDWDKDHKGDWDKDHKGDGDHKGPPPGWDKDHKGDWDKDHKGDGDRNGPPPGWDKDHKGDWDKDQKDGGDHKGPPPGGAKPGDFDKDKSKGGGDDKKGDDDRKGPPANWQKPSNFNQGGGDKKGGGDDRKGPPPGWAKPSGGGGGGGGHDKKGGDDRKGPPSGFAKPGGGGGGGKGPGGGGDHKSGGGDHKGGDGGGDNKKKKKD